MSATTNGADCGPKRFGCLVYRNQDPDYANSPEFQFLEIYVNRHIQQVFGESVDAAIASQIDSTAFQYVLWLGDNRTIITAESLKRMKERVDAGAEFVSPVRLDSIMSAIQTPAPTTLRLFEEFELELLNAKEHWPQPSPGMVLLGSGDAFRGLIDAESQNWFEQLGGSRIVHEGVCYRFEDYYGQQRADILPYIPADAKDVLEIGCARGLTGKLLQERLGCKVTGVERNAEIAEHARKHLTNVIVGNVETLSIADKFDVVIATELFEHLLEPIAFLQSMKAVVKQGGRLVLTVPNVGHWSIVEDLLRGRWDYLPMGILCYTHFRFFTRKTIEDWIECAGFSNYEIIRQTTDVPERFLSLGSIADVDHESLSTSGFYIVIHA